MAGGRPPGTVDRRAVQGDKMQNRPNVLLVMCDQLRFDTIAALGNEHIRTPNLDRLVRRGVSFTRAHTTCPVCIPARYIIRTGCEPPTTRCFLNATPQPLPNQPQTMEDRCGKYLPRTMTDLGYRTFGIGKFHCWPVWNEDLGYQLQLHSEEIYKNPQQRQQDSYARFISEEHPEFAFVEALMGERTEMYYQPQMSPLPADLTVEAWAADRAVEQLTIKDQRPFFGMVSFIGPHPPFAPPIPFNRMYDPDDMPNPIKGDLNIDHMDEQIPWMNHAVWADNITDAHARTLKARYFGEISYIDQCLGRILDAVEARPDADNTLICFFADHGDHLGDHHAWQKESFFEGACHVPFLLSWPARLPGDMRRDELVSLTDIFGIATTAAGKPQMRQGSDVLGLLLGKAQPRTHLVGYYQMPGQRHFKVMVRDKDWKYIFMANGGREQLFNLSEDPNELQQQLDAHPQVAAQLRRLAVQSLGTIGARDALDGDRLRSFPFAPRERKRIYQFEKSLGVSGFSFTKGPQ